jgi:hypothetical protein
LLDPLAVREAVDPEQIEAEETVGVAGVWLTVKVVVLVAEHPLAVAVRV